jgi:hypothetical protein
MSFFSTVEKANKSEEARTSFLAGLFCGAARNNQLPKFQNMWCSWEVKWQKVDGKIRLHAKSEDEKTLALQYVEAYSQKTQEPLIMQK